MRRDALRRLPQVQELRGTGGGSCTGLTRLFTGICPYYTMNTPAAKGDRSGAAALWYHRLMSDIPRLEVPTIAISGTNARFPVRRIFCVGRNYAEHAREMGADPDREPPFFFTKPADAVVDSGRRLPFPSRTVELHHEVEMVIALGAGGVEVQPAAAPSMIFGYAVG